MMRTTSFREFFPTPTLCKIIMPRIAFKDAKRSRSMRFSDILSRIWHCRPNLALALPSCVLQPHRDSDGHNTIGLHRLSISHQSLTGWVQSLVNAWTRETCESLEADIDGDIVYCARSDGSLISRPGRHQKRLLDSSGQEFKSSIIVTDTPTKSRLLTPSPSNRLQNPDHDLSVLGCESYLLSTTAYTIFQSTMPIKPPFVTKSILSNRGCLNNCCVRVICALLEHDACTAIAETTDGETLNVVFLKKSPDDFKFLAAYYLLEGIAKENGSYLLVEKEPQPLFYPGSFSGPRADVAKQLRQRKVKSLWSVLDEMTDFLHEREWLTSSGTVLPDPRFEPIVKAPGRIRQGKRKRKRRLRRTRTVPVAVPVGQMRKWRFWNRLLPNDTSAFFSSLVALEILCPPFFV
ncbi:hypothetical protein NP233_g3882 [Leucocoprinus birnbaumii]|uniref:Uncharacterized protein n=1 Tax=Leucocoprinus birnbaumii TaxID=56174 RepID=A0AAD5VW78_9AGAR|nr:hypothetical protein NP233_g3882 [Leucocoprinus birnbaumii]